MSDHPVRAERAALCDLLTDLGPDAPTRCEGSTHLSLPGGLRPREADDQPPADERAASLRTRRRRRVNQFRVCSSGLPGLAGNKLDLIGDPLPSSGLGELVSPHQRR